MKHLPHRLMFLAALALPALTACHIHNGSMDFSPVSDRMEPAVDDDVILDGDSRSISAPAPALAQAPVPAAAAAASPAPTPENPFIDTAVSAPAPKPAAAVTKPVAAAATGALYTVVAGDTLNGVARRHGTTPAALAAANGLTPTSGLRIGQKLRLPDRSTGVAATAKAPAAAPRNTAKLPVAKAARSYTVQPGDTLYRVAAKNGTTPAALMKANGLTPQTAGKIKVGSTLNIPANR